MQNSPSTTLAPGPKNCREGLRSVEKIVLVEQASLEPSELSQISESSFPIDPQIVTTVPSPPSSPTTLPSSEDNNITTRVNESGHIELRSGKSGPHVKAGAVLSLGDLDDLYEDARRYAKSRTKDDIENVRDIIAEAFPVRVHRDWFRAEKNTHLALVLESVDDSDTSAPSTFPFLNVLRRKFCGHDWAQVHAAHRVELKMNVGGVGCFDEYLSQVEGCNSRLKGVRNYLTPPQLLTILARGIAPTLTAILSEQGIVIDEETTYKSWVSACQDLE
ncbi:hypothetical protein C8R41DRAFT_872422, partial [Lentinula lateritia]